MKPAGATAGTEIENSNLAFRREARNALRDSAGKSIGVRPEENRIALLRRERRVSEELASERGEANGAAQFAAADFKRARSIQIGDKICGKIVVCKATAPTEDILQRRGASGRPRQDAAVARRRDGREPIARLPEPLAELDQYKIRRIWRFGRESPIE